LSILTTRRALTLLLAAAPACFGAEIYTETFTVGTKNWTNQGSAVWTLPAGTPKATFAQQFVPLPETGTAIAGPAASAGRFVGDYRAAGIDLIGFDFLSQDVPPSDVTIRLEGGTNVFFHSVPSSALSEVGETVRVMVSVRSRSEGGWAGPDEAAFEEGLQDVRSVSVSISRSGLLEQDYFFDNFFTDRLPEGVDIAFAPGSGPMAVFDYLREGHVYTVEALEDLVDGVWTNVGSLAATSRRQAWTDAGAEGLPHRYYRLLLP
jgi:hypothetical protein